MLKQGANQIDQARMRKLFAEGKSPEEIGYVLGIAIDVVKRFSPDSVAAAETAKAAEQAAKAESGNDEIQVPDSKPEVKRSEAAKEFAEVE